MDAKTLTALRAASDEFLRAKQHLRDEIWRAKSLGLSLPRDYYAALQEQVTEAERAYTEALAAAADPAVAHQLRECIDKLDAVRARIRSEQLHRRLTGVSRPPAREWFPLLARVRELEHQIASAWDSASGAILFDLGGINGSTTLGTKYTQDNHCEDASPTQQS
jgi:hypothetical protein